MTRTGRLVLTIASRKSSCQNHIKKKWALDTYKPRNTRTRADGSSSASRKRAGRSSQRQTAPLRPAALLPSPTTNRMLRPGVHRAPELMQYSIDGFVLGVFGRSVEQFTVWDLMRPKLDHGLSWQRIADLYWSAWKNKQAGSWKKVRKGVRQAHQEIRILVRHGNPGMFRLLWKLSDPLALDKVRKAAATPSKDVQRVYHHAFLAKFWRVCYQLLKMDLQSGTGFSFLLDFLMELEGVYCADFGMHHPIRCLVFSLAQVSREHVQDMLGIGVRRSMQVMAPGVTSSQKRALVIRWWTADVERTW
ncbi:hypothetical protein MHUMG1_10081 [Metarhizium humberi]|uniref:Uncharacterized protein n=1 Tax=Metarhizium humberi TaxID=2596975 RepID=A0A9P8S3C6_9HYPO|nr:hypothetical protein MHUMG1_10081 [Metarhizium humberi]